MLLAGYMTKFSLRTYVLFRTMGLRHLIVTDDTNKVVGMLSRKDLMGHALEDRLSPIVAQLGKSEGRAGFFPTTEEIE